MKECVEHVCNIPPHQREMYVHIHAMITTSERKECRIQENDDDKTKKFKWEEKKEKKK